ncbi:MAG: NfeD family protein [Candidatus Methanofastidiosia archaeon]|jgi:membrane protein implicated in regulation of membrane protease activity
MIETWLIWLTVAAVLAVGEIATEGFFLLWFAIGAAAASATAYIGLGTPWEWGVFIITSGILVVLSRPIANRFTKEQPAGIGANRYIGRPGVVLEEVNNVENTGQVRIGKEEWRADSSTGEIIPAGTKVQVMDLDGTHVVVTPVNEVNQ